MDVLFRTGQAWGCLEVDHVTNSIGFVCFFFRVYLGVLLWFLRVLPGVFIRFDFQGIQVVMSDLGALGHPRPGMRDYTRDWCLYSSNIF